MIKGYFDWRRDGSLGGKGRGEYSRDDDVKYDVLSFPWNVRL